MRTSSVVRANQAISHRPSRLDRFKKKSLRVVSMYIAICALHGMVPCLTAGWTPAGHHLGAVSRALGLRVLSSIDARDGMTSVLAV